MTALRVLADLEYSRHSLKRRGKKQALLLTLALSVMLLAAGLYIPFVAASQRSPFIAAALLLWIVIMGISAMHMLNFQRGQHKEWFLTFPHSRLTLLQAKAISLLKHSLNLALLFSAAAVTIYVISFLSGRYVPLPAGELVLMLASYFLFILVLLPLAVLSGLLFSALMSIQNQVLLLLLVIPYTFLWMLPFFAAAILNTAPASIYGLQYLSPSFVMLYSAALLLLDLSAYYFLLPLIARSGFRALAQPEHKPFAFPFVHSNVKRIHADGAALPASSRSSFLTLYRLDSSRLRQFERLRIAAVLKIAVPLVIAAGAYFGSEDLSAFQPTVRMPFMLPVLFGSLWMMSRSSIERKQLPWWLLFPQSRMRLLLSGIAAVWITVMRINTVLACSALTGILAGLTTGNARAHDATLYLSWLLYSFLVYTLALTVALCLLQASYYLMKSSTLSLVTIPLALIVPFQSTLINKFLFPADFVSGMHPSWSLLGWIALIGLPLAACCVPAGSRYFHLALATNKEASAIKQA